jgi:OOP family OmpA-OmpF porin
MKISSRILAAALFVSLPGIAAAQSNGMYAGAGLGWNWLDGSSFSSTTGSTSADADSDWMGNAFFGYAYGNGFRTELEVNHRNNDYNSLNGDVSSWGLFANGFYDINTGTAFTPYVGAGIGALRLNYNDVASVQGSTVDAHDYVLGYQLIAGVSYALNDNLSLFTDARLQGSQDPEVKTNSGIKEGTDYENRSVMVGFRWSFGAPKPAPTPVAQPQAQTPPPAQPQPTPPAAPAIARNYLVFFDFDKSSLTNEAMNIVRTAAANAKQGNVVRIQLTGHADRSGSDAYNLRLSQRRADAIKAELVHQGLTAGEITTVAKGEREPLVPTADGVREPQNRRVEIVFQ